MPSLFHVAPPQLLPRGLRFRVELPDGPSRGYICETYGAMFRLPELGPLGANGLANARDFLAPVAAYEDVSGPFSLVAILNDLHKGRDTGKAWSQLMLQLMRHLALLTRSGVISNLKDVLAVARDVEEHIRKVSAVGGGRDGEQRLPMDEIGQKWRVEPQSDESAETPTQTKTPSRRKAASANKSITSNGSASSSAKTNSETSGSEL